MMFSQRTGFFPPADTVSPFVGSEITTSTNILYPYTQYSTSSLAYLGPDNNNRAVFIFIFIEPGTGALKGQAFRINDNGTLFFGTTSTLDANAAGAHTVSVTSEYEGAGSFANPTYDFLRPTSRWFCSYTKPGTQQLVAVFGTVQLNQAGLPNIERRAPLALTFGTTDGDFPVATFLGRRPATGSNTVQYQVLFGMRTGGGFVTRRYWTDGSTVLTAQGPAQIPNGGAADTAALGFAADFSTPTIPVYRSGYWNTGGGGNYALSAVMTSQASNTSSPAAANYRTEIQTSPSILDTSRYNQACNLNNSNKFLAVSFLSPANTLNLTVVDVTWNNPPALPTPTVGAFVSAGSASNPPTLVSGFTTDTAFLVQSPAGSSSLTYAPITVAGTVPTVGSTQTLFGGLSNCIGPPILATGRLGTKTYLAGIQSRSGSNTPYVFGVRFT
jgi:hypothetical protein